MTAIAAGRLRRPHTAWHCCLEFYAVATRLPEELRLSPAEAWQLLDEEVLGRFDVRELPGESRRAFFETAVHDRLIGGRIYDEHLADIARLARMEVVVTDNVRHFTGLRRHGIEVLSAAQFAERL
jgi:predicted nucleic acid-binding protein